jgi:UDPglucose 6-dehydrogenase
MKICIIGTGYVGLVTGTCFADIGNNVWCIDSNAAIINSLNSGILPIYEPGLPELVQKNVQEGRLHFSTDKKSIIEKSLFCFITVSTPSGTNGEADLSQVFGVAREVGRFLDHYMIIVNKSTVPVGTASTVRQIIQEELAKRGRSDLEFDIVSNPEFLKEGAALEDFMHPNRVVIGTNNIHAAELMKNLYHPLIRNRNPLLIMDIPSAEITKYAANTMLATRISFINEIARLCDKVGADVSSVRQGIGTDDRIGTHFLYAGAGYGGSCFPKDIKELIHTGQKNGVAMEIAQAVERVNDRQKSYILDMVRCLFGDNLTGKKFAIWGLAFKPETDDMRESPAIVIVASLLQSGASVVVYDPQAVHQAKETFRNLLGGIYYADDMMNALDDADALILITEWQQFRQPDFTEIKQRLRQPVIFDGRNQYAPEQMDQMGFRYFCIGRGRYVN